MMRKNNKWYWFIISLLIIIAFFGVVDLSPVEKNTSHINDDLVLIIMAKKSSVVEMHMMGLNELFKGQGMPLSVCFGNISVRGKEDIKADGAMYSFAITVDGEQLPIYNFGREELKRGAFMAAGNRWFVHVMPKKL